MKRWLTSSAIAVLLLACSGGGGEEEDPVSTPFNPGTRLAEIIGEPGSCWQPGGVSRDGRQIAFVRGSQTGHDAPCEYDAIALADLRSGKVRDFAPVGWWPLWSPDGTTLLIEGQADRTAWCARSAALVDVDTGERRELMALLSSILGFSPDGKYVLLTYCRLGHLDKEESIVVDLEGNIVKRLGAIAIAWTPEGDIIVQDEWPARFKIIGLPDGEPRPIPTPVMALLQEQYPWEIVLEPCDDVIDRNEVCY